jgi:hypothetical protein
VFLDNLSFEMAVARSRGRARTCLLAAEASETFEVEDGNAAMFQAN